MRGFGTDPAPFRASCKTRPVYFWWLAGAGFSPIRRDHARRELIPVSWGMESTSPPPFSLRAACAAPPLSAVLPASEHSGVKTFQAQNVVPSPCSGVTPFQAQNVASSDLFTFTLFQAQSVAPSPCSELRALRLHPVPSSERCAFTLFRAQSVAPSPCSKLRTFRAWNRVKVKRSELATF